MFHLTPKVDINSLRWIAHDNIITICDIFLLLLGSLFASFGSRLQVARCVNCYRGHRRGCFAL